MGYGSVIDGVSAFPGTDDATIIPIKRVDPWGGVGSSLSVFKEADFITTHDVMGHNWVPDSWATLTIDNGADGIIDLERTNVVEEDGDARFPGDGADPPFEVGEGDIVELSDGVTRITYPVTYLTLESINRDTNVISGRAREGTEVEVGIWDPSLPNPHVTDIHVLAGSSETWTVDFTGVFDIVSDTTGWVATIESIPASTSTWW